MFQKWLLHQKGSFAVSSQLSHQCRNKDSGDDDSHRPKKSEVEEMMRDYAAAEAGTNGSGIFAFVPFSIGRVSWLVAHRMEYERMDEWHKRYLKEKYDMDEWSYKCLFAKPILRLPTMKGVFCVFFFDVVVVCLYVSTCSGHSVEDVVSLVTKSRPAWLDVPMDEKERRVSEMAASVKSVWRVRFHRFRQVKFCCGTRLVVLCWIKFMFCSRRWRRRIDRHPTIVWSLGWRADRRSPWRRRPGMAAERRTTSRSRPPVVLLRCAYCYVFVRFVTLGGMG